MTFHRSRSALASMHLFYRVDVVVFCEGGPSRTLSEVLSDNHDTRTLDIIYWANVISYLKLSKKFHLKSVGDKPTLRQIAEDISLTGCATATVCFDSDYDGQLGIRAPGKRIAFTHGYSWESDVAHPMVSERVLRHLYHWPSQLTDVCPIAQTD